MAIFQYSADCFHRELARILSLSMFERSRCSKLWCNSSLSELYNFRNRKSLSLKCLRIRRDLNHWASIRVWRRNNVLQAKFDIFLCLYIRDHWIKIMQDVKRKGWGVISLPHLDVICIIYFAHLLPYPDESCSGYVSVDADNQENSLHKFYKWAVGVVACGLWRLWAHTNNVNWAFGNVLRRPILWGPEVQAQTQAQTLNRCNSTIDAWSFASLITSGDS